MDRSTATRPPLTTDRGYPSDYVLALTQTTDGLLWVGTVASGAYAVDLSTGTMEASFRTDGLSQRRLTSNRVHAIRQLDDGRILTGVRDADGGFGSLAVIVSETMTVAQTYEVGTVWDIQQGTGGTVYLGTNRGLLALDLDSGAVAEVFRPESDPLDDSIRSYGRVHGVQDLEFNLNSSATLSGGRLIFGGVNGVSAFDPADMEVDLQPPDVYLSSVLLFNQPLVPGAEVAGRVVLQNTIETTEALELRHDENTLTLEIGAADYAAPEGTTFRHQLVGFDRDWVDSGSRRYATYTNLPPGDFEFRYQAASTAGAWPDEYGSLAIRISPAFIQTWPFFLIIVTAALLLAAAVALYTIRLRREIRDRAEAERQYRELNANLETMVVERTKHLETALADLELTQDRLVESEKLAALGTLVAGIAHEINTPVGIAVTGSSSVHTRADELLELHAQGRLTQDQFARGVGYIREATELVEGSLARAARLVANFKMAALDQADEEMIPTVFPDYIQQIIETVQHQYKRDRVTVRVECDEPFTASVVRGAVWQIITNLMQNSLVHGFEKDRAGAREGEIVISVGTTPGRLEVSYSDNGRGMDKETLERASEPFFTTNRIGRNTGLGMFIVHNMVTKTLGGRIVLESAPGAGVRIHMSVPLSV